ncbi:MAG: glycosyltransferase [Acidimicrobiales bacterium]|jgi:GT2 family glycosyltransferase|nr:glycosyltransferase [Acidimicrobiales bacterium]
MIDDSGWPAVALVVLNWNGLHDTDRCLRSVAACTYRRLEVIVVDNGSNDGTVTFVRDEHPHVTLLELGANRGYAAGNNAGIRYAAHRGADLIGVLNNDTVVEPDFLEPIVNELRARPDGFVSPRIMYLSQPSQAWFGAAVIDQGTGIVYHRNESTLSEAEQSAQVRDEPAVTGCCVIAWRSTWERVGLFDERYFLIFEDSDWCARACSAGYQARVVTSSTIHHAVSSSFATTSSAVGHYYYARNALLYVRSHGRRPFRQTLRLLRKLYRDSVATIVHEPGRESVKRLGWQTAGVLDFARGRYGHREIFQPARDLAGSLLDDRCIGSRDA